jgi:hypothetical protein
MAAIETELEEMRAFITEEILPAVDLIVHDVEHEITCMLRVCGLMIRVVTVCAATRWIAAFKAQEASQAEAAGHVRAAKHEGEDEEGDGVQGKRRKGEEA